MISAAVIDAMVASGCTAEQLAAVVKASLADGEAKASKRREKDAERQRRKRSKVVTECHDDSRTVTECHADNSDPSPSLPPNEIYSNPPTHPHPDNNTRTRKGTQTPAKPEGVSEQVWRDFLDLRKRKRANLTETSLDGIRREAGKAGWTMEDALAETVTRGWQSFKADFVAPKEIPRQANGNHGQSDLIKSILGRG